MVHSEVVTPLMSTSLSSGNPDMDKRSHRTKVPEGPSRTHKLSRNVEALPFHSEDGISVKST